MEMLLLSEERECGKMKKKKSMFIILCMLTVLAAGTAHATEKERVDPLQPAIAEKILRFHVLANSDAKDDQNVKLKVRDAVGHMLGQKLKKVTDRAQTEKIVQDHMDEIIETAEKTLHKNGYTYGASARLANVDFPVKTYGDYTFPAGKYRALQITLGKGEGHNWWCVLYPNMCFQGSVYEVMDESSGEELREVLTQEEYFRYADIPALAKCLPYSYQGGDKCDPDGYENTKKLIEFAESNGIELPAVDYVKNYSPDNVSVPAAWFAKGKWFLPSLNQMYLIFDPKNILADYVARRRIGNTKVAYYTSLCSQTYWTSNRTGSTISWFVGSNTGNYWGYYKSISTVAALPMIKY